MKFSSILIVFITLTGLGNVLILHTAELKRAVECKIDIFDAINDSKYEVVEKLIKESCPIDFKNDFGQTPLIVAVKSALGLKTLIKKDSSDLKILRLSSQIPGLNEMEKCIQMMQNSLVSAMKIINLILNQGANLNIIDSDGFSVFDYAEDDREISKILNDEKERREKEIRDSLNISLVPPLIDIICKY